MTGWTLCGVGLILRAGWVLYRWFSDGSALSYPDEELHWQLAGHLFDEGTLVSDNGRFASRMPLYPMFLALFAGCGQMGVLLARLAQAVLGAATVLIGYRLTDVAAGRRAAIVAGVLLCCDPFAVFFSNLLLTETLFTLLAIGLIACAWQLLSKPHGGHDALLGLAVLGAGAILTRPSAAAWIPALWLMLAWLAADRRRLIPRLLLCPVILAVLLAPWGLRNKAVLGSFAWLSTNGGVTLYDAQGQQADGSSNQTFLHELPELQGLDEVALDRELRHLAVEHMREDPVGVARLAVVKFLRTWSLTPNVSEYRGGLAAVAGAVYTVIVLLGGFAGLVGALRAKRRHQMMFWRLAPSRRSLHAMLWLPVVCFTLVHCVYIGSVRYRVPLMPLLAVAAGTVVARPVVGRSG